MELWERRMVSAAITSAGGFSSDRVYVLVLGG